MWYSLSIVRIEVVASGVRSREVCFRYDTYRVG